MHCDAILKAFSHNWSYKANPGHVDLQKLEKGECFLQFYAIFFELDQTKTPYDTYQKMYDHFMLFVKKTPQVRLIQSAHDVQEDGLNILLSIEEGGVLEGQIDRLVKLKNDGVRSITLTWNFENEIGYPNYRYYQQHQGLKPFGRTVVEAMNHHKMLIDVSHLSDKGTEDACAISKQPVIASHSNARAITESSRNLSDPLIKKIANTGGVIGLNFCPYFVHKDETMRLDALIDHAHHLIKVGGIDVLAIGTDFDGISGSMEIKNASEMQKLYHAFIKAGFNPSSIEKIFYKNALRVIQDVLT